MKHMISTGLILAVVPAGLLFMLTACEGAPPKPSKYLSQKSSADDEASDECSDTEDDSETGLRLASDQDATYEGKVKGILNGKCAFSGCHAAGMVAPDLSTYQLSKAQGVRIIASSVTGATMPKGPSKLDATDKDILQTWATKGYPLGVASAPAPLPLPMPVPTVEKPILASPAAAPTYAEIAKLMTEKTCVSCHSTAVHTASVILDTVNDYNANALNVSTTLQMPHPGLSFDAVQLKLTADYAAALDSAASPSVPAEESPAVKAPVVAAKAVPKSGCSVQKKSGNSADSTSDNKMLDPPKLKECHDSGLLYDRRIKDCHVATFGSDFDCNWDGVKSAFAKTGEPALLDKLEESKWQVDQCGENDGDPVVFLILVDNSKGVANYSIKLLGVD